jgi:hypothetical protein
MIAANKEANKHTKTNYFMTPIYFTALSVAEINQWACSVE